MCMENAKKVSERGKIQIDSNFLSPQLQQFIPRARPDLTRIENVFLEFANEVPARPNKKSERLSTRTQLES